jgi:hypothetical protein
MSEKTPSEQIDDIIKLHPNWQGKLIQDLRAIITGASAEIVEEIKWKMRTRPEGLPVWSSNGIVCYIETFKNDSKLVFFYGSQLKDTNGLFNARLKSSVRAIEFYEGYDLNKQGLIDLVKEAVTFNSNK